MWLYPFSVYDTYIYSLHSAMFPSPFHALILPQNIVYPVDKNVPHFQSVEKYP